MCEVADWIYNQGKLAGETEGRAEGKAEGKAEGRAEGTLNEKRATALELHKIGMEEADIAKIVRYDRSAVRGWIAATFT